VCDPAPDLANFKKKFNKKIYKQFKESISDCETIWDTFLDIKPITKGDENVTIGYVYKEGHNKRKGYHSGVPDAFITDCVKAYHAKERIDSRKSYKHDITLLSSKNFSSKVIDYVNRTEETSFKDSLLEYKMIKDRYDFLNISKYQTVKGFRQLRIMYGQENDNDRIETVRQQYADEESQAQDMIMDLKTLIFGNPDPLELKKFRQKYYWIEDKNFL
jgi:hypothetical protein